MIEIFNSILAVLVIVLNMCVLFLVREVKYHKRRYFEMCRMYENLSLAHRKKGENNV